MKKIVFDWAAYAKEFAKAHGNDAVLIENQLVFSDGWRYHTEIEGMETPPPVGVKEQLELRTDYWNRKIAILKEQAKLKIQQLKLLIELQEEHSERLQQLMLIQETDQNGNTTTKPIVSEVALELELLEVSAMVEKVKEARQALANLTYIPPVRREIDKQLHIQLIELESEL